MSYMLTPAPVAPVVPVTRIVFYCKDCDKLVSGIKIGNKYVYKCPQCGTKNVAFGTEKAIRNFYHVKDLPDQPKAAPTPTAPVVASLLQKGVPPSAAAVPMSPAPSVPPRSGEAPAASSAASAPQSDQPSDPR